MNNFFADFFSASNFAFTPDIAHMCMSFIMNLVVVWIIVHFFYYPKGHRRDYYFTFLMLAVSIFMLISVLLKGSSDMGIGAALGLFAIFGIIRYRTESVPIRAMTYLFFLVALSVLNGKIDDLNFLGRLIINVLFIIVVWVSESCLSAYREGCRCVKYDNSELIEPERFVELVAGLEKRLGLLILRVDVGAVDFLTDMTMLRVFYKDPSHRIKAVDRILKIPADNAF